MSKFGEPGGKGPRKISIDLGGGRQIDLQHPDTLRRKDSPNLEGRVDQALDELAGAAADLGPSIDGFVGPTRGLLERDEDDEGLDQAGTNHTEGSKE